MNGRVDRSTPHPRRFFRSRHATVLLFALSCLMSLALLGAIRAATPFRAEPLLAVAQAPITEWGQDRLEQPAETPAAEPVLGALNEPAQHMLVSPVPPGGELLRPMAPAPAVAVPTAIPTPLPIRLPELTAPTLAGSPRMLLMEVTAYCACKKCCGPRAQGLTASGRRVSYNNGRFVAADTRLLRFNTRLQIPGYANGQPVEVIDRGGAIKGRKLDVFFDSHQQARTWGRQWLWVTVLD